MKTGGTSFAQLVRANFRKDECYPDALLPPESDLLRRMEAYSFVPRLVAEVNARSTLRMVRGHVPYCVRSMLKADYIALTLLRNPVERTLSYLNHCRTYHQEHSNSPVEEIYEQPWFFKSFIHNYQTKLFSMTADEATAETRLGDIAPPLPPRSAFLTGEPLPSEAQQLLTESPARLALELFSPPTGALEADKERLQSALRNLGEVDLVGVTEDYGSFLKRLRDQHGWRIDFMPRSNVGETATRVSSAFRKRIAEDNSLDMALYEKAREMVL